MNLVYVNFLDGKEWKNFIKKISKGTEFWKPRNNPNESLKIAAKIFNNMGGKIIVEVGSGIHGKMAGKSVLVWSRKTNAKKIFCLDINEEQIKKVKEATKENPAVHPILIDGFEFMKNCKERIDLLYLDFWQDSARARANSYLKIYKYARKKMNKNSMILIDDTDHGDPWKQTLIVPAACNDGFRVVYVGRQTLLYRGKDIGKVSLLDGRQNQTRIPDFKFKKTSNV